MKEKIFLEDAYDYVAEIVAENLQRLLRTHHYSYQKLAERMNEIRKEAYGNDISPTKICRSQIYKYVHSKSSHLQAYIFYNFCGALEVSPEQLFPIKKISNTSENGYCSIYELPKLTKEQFILLLTAKIRKYMEANGWTYIQLAQKLAKKASELHFTDPKNPDSCIEDHFYTTAWRHSKLTDTPNNCNDITLIHLVVLAHTFDVEISNFFDFASL